MRRKRKRRSCESCKSSFIATSPISSSLSPSLSPLPSPPSSLFSSSSSTTELLSSFILSPSSSSFSSSESSPSSQQPSHSNPNKVHEYKTHFVQLEYAAARQGMTLTSGDATCFSEAVLLSSDLLPQNSKQMETPPLSLSICDHSIIQTLAMAASSTVTVSATLSTSPTSTQAAQHSSSGHSSTQSGMGRQKSAKFQSGSILRSTKTIRMRSSLLHPVRTFSERFLSTSYRFHMFLLSCSFSLL
ncbi:uncharacterized protein MONOS_15794 [Monocercomonoides exilis]|uniref:uncharacterized protein n=1 Tax=Monocercomonoides exilis TaxID=2049356 RepID=UPI003559AFB0|nr:hypothetical protein MONOS_15794 [Monocercomonoides exilis]|eukprot:MONOS_15794.1-p1 / transcript=MONOS_15794.1 / gene=MONOS_15794 / organism=Monocercomonoides_exilis_PA203 / gene_product=unspecified product / transcript_product=unspecified product / location=Mono_scaffold01358:8481-9212(-) / protein_length=244 / sequence_SO=supercontig / SO=protein_coding / is_pseudo=false